MGVISHNYDLHLYFFIYLYKEVFYTSIQLKY